MKLYSAIINLSGNAYNQVFKTDLTAAEICLLQSIHQGGEHSAPPVANIKETGEVNRTDAEERDRLIGRGKDDSPPLYSAANYRKVFTSDFIPLPQVVPPEFLTKAPTPTIVADTPLSAEQIEAEIARLQKLRPASSMMD
jgi:hypothetical protein